MKKTLIILLSIITLASCTSNNDFKKGKQQLKNQGYTNIIDTGYSWLCCDQKDTFSTGFTAIDKNGNKVESCICSGIFKGVTIRF